MSPWEIDLAHREAESAGWDNLRRSILCTRRKTWWRRQRFLAFVDATALFAAGCMTSFVIFLVLVMVGVL